MNGRKICFVVALTFFILMPAACRPTAEGNVLGYLAAKRLGTLRTFDDGALPGALTGVVYHNGAPVAAATVVVAERLGRPHAGQTDAHGRYRIEGIPPGQYVPAAVGPGFEETIPKALLGIPWLVTVQPGAEAQAPPIELQRHHPAPLPEPLAFAVQLTITAAYTIATNFPPHAQARVQAFQFTHKGAVVDTLRLYLPLDVQPEQRFPLLFMIYPTNADNWWPVSVAFASQEYALVAISPIAARGVEIDSHAQDARIAFALARQGALGSHIASDKAIALGGSFSSPILHRFLRDEGEEVAGWVNVGGVSNAFSGAADFYAGKLEMPPQFELVIPALGPPNLYPLTFLRYSPVYTAAQLPATLIIHTAADRITPIDQAYQLEEALRAAGAPVEVFYYEDVSHYLQIGDDLTEAGAEMFYRILDFVKRYQ